MFPAVVRGYPSMSRFPGTLFGNPGVGIAGAVFDFGGPVWGRVGQQFWKQAAERSEERVQGCK